MALLKYADDMTLAAHVVDAEALSQYQLEVNTLVQVFAENSLELNISKTKELWSKRTTSTCPEPAHMHP